MNDTWTVRSVLCWTAEYFDRRGVDAPRLTAEVLLGHVLQASRVQLYIDLDRPLSKAELAGYRALIERRAGGEPTQYLTGTREFFGRPFAVDSRVLIPRPETELVVEKALQALPKEGPYQVLDLCTGSGCIAVTVAAERPNALVWATEISPDACEIARANARTLNVADRLRILEGDLYGPLEVGARFNAVLSNPPYVHSSEIAGLAAEVRREPMIALDGGADGLVVIRRIVEQAPQWLEPGGMLAIEVDERQAAQVLQLLVAAGLDRTGLEKDFSKLDRLAFGYRP